MREFVPAGGDTATTRNRPREAGLKFPLPAAFQSF